MCAFKSNFQTCFGIVLLLFTLNCAAQSYCGLRDPINQIRTLYPESDNHRSIVRTVDLNVRESVSKTLPFTLLFNELGEHTLYVAQSGRRPLGIVHARSEKGAWGLNEIAWSIGFDEKIKDFQLQRCRSLNRKYVESEEFRSIIRNKSLEELSLMMSEEGSIVATSITSWPESAKELASSVLQSAMKTIVVTNNVWADDMRTLSIFHDALPLFPDAVGIQPIDGVPAQAISLRLAEKNLSPKELGIDITNIQAGRVFNEEKLLFGFFVCMTLMIEGEMHKVAWGLDTEGSILAVEPFSEFNTEIKSALSKTIGINPNTKLGPSVTPIELIALAAVEIVSL